jgi:linearmycin/streptolysin S transport system permease protein
MGLGAFLALARKDLQLFFSDRRAVILTFAVPIAIASFFGSIFRGGGDNDSEPAKIPIAIVDRDGSAISQGIVSGIGSDKSLATSTPPLEQARTGVQQGDVAVVVIIPPGFGDAAGRAFLSQGAKPEVELLFDPSRGAELAMVRGILTGHVMEGVGREVFGGPQGRVIVDETLSQLDASAMPAETRETLRNLLQSVRRLNQQPGGTGGGPMTVPYTVKQDAVVAGGRNAQYNGYAHSFAGMGIQFLLFAAVELAMGILIERELGIWKRFRSAPLSRFTLLAARGASGTIITLLTLLVSFAFAMMMFGVKIHGSVIGFAAIAVACSIMAATFGLLVAALGKTAAATRRVATFAVLIMVMLGGAWVPSFIFPAWLQRITVVIPARWAVDGLDAMTWRGLGLDAAITPTLVLLGFAVLFALVTVIRFRWEEA